MASMLLNKDGTERWLDIKGYDITIKPGDALQSLPNKPFKVRGVCGCTTKSFLLEDFGEPGKQYYGFVRMEIDGAVIRYWKAELISREIPVMYKKYNKRGLEFLFELQDRFPDAIAITPINATIIDDLLQGFIEEEGLEAKY